MGTANCIRCEYKLYLGDMAFSTENKGIVCAFCYLFFEIAHIEQHHMIAYCVHCECKLSKENVCINMEDGVLSCDFCYNHYG